MFLQKNQEKSNSLTVTEAVLINTFDQYTQSTPNWNSVDTLG